VRLAELGEFGLLAELERAGLAHGIENDAAALPGGTVVTQDALLEHVHFRLEWTSWRDLGYKAAAVNLSDLAASGAEPQALLVTLGVPGDTELDQVLELYAGLAEPGVPVVGGDTTASDAVYLGVTALGHSARVPGRGGARPGDALVVTGPLGASGAGFHSLREGLGSPLERAHLRPPLRLAEGRQLAGHAAAMIDLSDGLAADAAHIAQRSACMLVIDVERVPIADGVADVAEQIGEEAWRLACGFGEDYELLAAVEQAGPFLVVGRCETGSGVEIRLGDRLVDLSGWDHFG
jgi:thiamine-monophosphate kinase